MNNTRKASLLLLSITALASSRTLFALFNDPEGPNLLIVTGLGAILYFASLAVYARDSSVTDLKKFFFALSIQILLVIGLYFLLK